MFKSGKEEVWLKEKTQPSQEKDQGDDDEPIPEDDDVTLDEEDDQTVEQNLGMQLDTPEEIETRNRMWLMGKVTSLKKWREAGEDPRNGGEAGPTI